MRVGLVIYGSLDTLSGGYLYDRRLVEYLRAQGDSVTIVSLPWRGYVNALADNFRREWAERLAALNVDILLEDELNHPSLFLANGPLVWRGRFPVLSIVHHLRSSELHPAPWMRLYRRVERAYLRSVEGFIFNSQATRTAVQALAGLAAPGVVATPAGDRFGALPENEILARARASGPLRLLFLGNLIPRKGLHTLLNALSLLPAGDWTLRVVGRADADPGYARRMMAQAAGLGEKVQFLGRLPEDSLRQELRAADVLVVPSSYEGFGIVYLEGMAFGLPAIATTAGGAAEVITSGENGWLVPPGDAPALAETVTCLLSRPERLAEMSQAARRRFAAFPTWKETALSIRATLLEWTGSHD